MVLGYVADFMAYDTEKFVIVHHIHQCGKYSYTAVGTGKCVDVSYFVDLEVERDSVDIVKIFGYLSETHRVWIIFRCHGIVLVHPVDRLFHVGCHLRVG